MTSRILLTFLAAALLAPASASAQTHSWPVDDVLFEHYLTVRGGGSAHPEQGDDFPMDPAIGAGLRLAIPAGENLAFGPMLAASAVRFQGDGDRDGYFDFGGFGRFHHRVNTRGRVALDFMVTVPVGFTVANTDPDAALGYHVAVLPGVRLSFEHWAIFHEVGWQRHHVFDDGRGLAIDQAAFHFGAAHRF